jgi:hypothetical protein
MADEEHEENTPEGREEHASAESLERVPEPIKALFSSFFASKSVFPPFLEKINEKHIDKVLDYSEKRDERDFKNASQERRYGFLRFLLLTILVVGLVVFLTVYLVDRDKELYRDVLRIGLGAAGGAGLGGGVGYHFGRKSAKGDES